ncbi:MAG: GNAT family N-acetyltransferase [Liquorilactobacillus nagelii]|uniref:GNAT family N-acetyltransferase n=1 Tax=Liquorilactobacillus nagelii TaxID=82688 RepID=A0A3S6QZD2_9LACO|nr:GNAT family N-acetyltransferase [Liquorilactobacillus nagelii]AUJ31555.1 GNAT family N-acetyltransferase [Liquorilactobacillus nagelii]MCC7616084.1 GNAT family N-acetyltransferase [Liquorilactobacillus nagelii]MCI1699552.1 GNAT family N-acetyltransferase [Liquorilactobacillus nagelii]MCP9314391.1 GNAT family N-acetyltransferase [Liquorilactobacillus nagelii]
MYIRAAVKNDAAQIVPLFKIILAEMELPSLKVIPTKKLDQVIQYSFSDPNYLKDAAQTIVAEDQGKIAGFAWGYPNEKENLINQILVNNFPKVGLPADTELFEDDEAFDNEWYLDSIAVSPNYQGQGIGTALLKKLPSLAKNHEKKQIGLNVDWANPQAEKLYRRLGFKKVGTTKLSQHSYNHLIYQI